MLACQIIPETWRVSMAAFFNRINMTVRRRWADFVSRQFVRLLNSSHSEYLLQKLNIPGTGKNLSRTYFPITVAARPVWGWGLPVQSAIEEQLTQQIGEFRSWLPKLQKFAPVIGAWSEAEQPEFPQHPYRDNVFLNVADALALYAMIAEHRPPRYVEIGSGNSTRVAACVRRDLGLEMEIISIDPFPRADIDEICNECIREPLQNVVERLKRLVRPGDLLFMDGSHYTVPGNDTTVFFLDIIPALPAGVLVHVHDIYWPVDYPQRHLCQLWSEQYLLGCWLLGGGRRMQILFPNFFMYRDDTYRAMIESIMPVHPTNEYAKSAGTSFWWMSC
jgi:hypothetical protein